MDFFLTGVTTVFALLFYAGKIGDNWDTTNNSTRIGRVAFFFLLLDVSAALFVLSTREGYPFQWFHAGVLACSLVIVGAYGWEAVDNRLRRRTDTLTKKPFEGEDHGSS